MIFADGHKDGCTFPTSGSCTCGANLPWLDNEYHPFVRGHGYHDPSSYHRVGPRGGLHRMSHDTRADVETLMSCAQVVIRTVGREDTLVLCGKPRFQHSDYREDIR